MSYAIDRRMHTDNSRRDVKKIREVRCKLLIQPSMTPEAPTRIQLCRQPGWRMPPSSVKVDRTTKWGNPFDVREYGHALALHIFEHTARGCWSRANVKEIDELTASMLHEAHCRWLRRLGGDPVQIARTELRGKNLACWCTLPKPGQEDACHATFLLRIANE